MQYSTRSIILHIDSLNITTHWLNHFSLTNTHRIDMELLRLSDKPEYFKQMKEQKKKVPGLPTINEYNDYAALNSNYDNSDIIEQ